MVQPTETHHVSPESLPGINQVSSDRPWVWLAAGWNDFVRVPGVSMTYGLLLSAVMILAFYFLQSIDSYYLALGLMAGFIFIGPLLAVGLYELSRRIEHHKPATIPDTWYGWSRNRGSVLAMGVVLVLMMLTWFMLSIQLTAVVYGVTGELATTFPQVADWEGVALSVKWPVFMAFGAMGLLAVSVTYVLTVVAVPMLLDREDMDVITAMVISVQTVRKNPVAMSLWAILLAIFTGVAVAPVFLGLIFVFPLLAYASWHAYRDLIEH